MNAPRSVRAVYVRDASLLPPGVTPSHVAVDVWRTALLAQGEGWTLRVVRHRDGSASVTVTAETDAIGEQVVGWK